MRKTATPLTLLVRYSRASTDFTVRVLRGLVWPKIDVLIRLALAEIFFVSGVLKLTHWNTALDLAANEYPVSFMSPVTAAYVGVSIEVVGAVLLALGFMTRYAAVPMLILSLVIQFAYKPFDSQLFWAALFGWYAIQGAGPVSVDYLLRRGLADSALPLIPRILRWSEWIRVHAAPAYVSLLRIWLAAALLVTAWHVMLPDSGYLSTLALWLPLDVAARVPPTIVLFGGILLLLGLGTRYLAVAMILAMLADAMMDPRQTDAVYLLMTFSIIIIYGGGIFSLDRIAIGAARQIFSANRCAGSTLAGGLAARRHRRRGLCGHQLRRGAAQFPHCGDPARSRQLPLVSATVVSSGHGGAFAGRHRGAGAAIVPQCVQRSGAPRYGHRRRYANASRQDRWERDSL